MTPKGLALPRTAASRAAPLCTRLIFGTVGCFAGVNVLAHVRRVASSSGRHAPLRAAFPATEAKDNTRPMQIRNTQLGTDLHRRVAVWGIIPRTSDARPYTVIWWLVRIWLQQLPFIEGAATGKNRVTEQGSIPHIRTRA